MNKLTLNKLVLKRILIIFIIIFAIFDCNIVFASENINDYIMEEIADNTKHRNNSNKIRKLFKF